MYEYKTRVRYTDSAFNGEMSLSAVIDCFQNVFHFECDDTGVGTQDLIMKGIIGIICFCKSFLKARKLSKETIILTKAENITADYYFTYFSLFVISFFGVDPTKLKDVLILSVLMVLIIWVYMANEMYFVNPVLNIVGYKAFSIVYHKSTSAKRLDDDKSLQSFEIKVFSREPLNRMTREKLFVTFSPHDFSICYSIPREKSDL